MGKRLWIGALLLLVMAGISNAFTSSGTDTLYDTWYSNPVFEDTFVGTKFRDFVGAAQTGAELELSLNATSGVFDTGIMSYFDGPLVDRVHNLYYVTGYYDVVETGTGAGNWWVGPKINVNFVGYPTYWWENYVVENSDRTPATWNTLLTSGLGGTYVGQSCHDASCYKHYRVPWASWQQLWAIRQVYRKGGPVSIKKILKHWRTYGGLPNYPIDEMRLNIETSGQQQIDFLIHDVYIPENYVVRPDPRAPYCQR